MKLFYDYAHLIGDATRSIDCAEVELLVDMVTSVWLAGRRLYVCGNGGSAAIAAHFAADLGKCGSLGSRPILPAQCLNSDPFRLTAIANDLGFDQIFAQQLRCSAAEDDLLLCISSSGRSPNIIEALKAAHNMGLSSILLTGQRYPDLGPARDFCDVILRVEHCEYEVIEDAHQLICHYIVRQVHALAALKLSHSELVGALLGGNSVRNAI